MFYLDFLPPNSRCRSYAYFSTSTTYPWILSCKWLWDFVRERDYACSGLMDAGKTIVKRPEIVRDVSQRLLILSHLQISKIIEGYVLFRLRLSTGPGIGQNLLYYRQPDSDIFGALALALAFGHDDSVELRFGNGILTPPIADVDRGSYKKTREKLRTDRN
jgi:hypothetical protein